jgi:23S rRNA (guanosine2251-2'-O)-methyltransferase
LNLGRKPRRAELLGNHQRSWLWGRNLVRETVLAQKWPLLELWLADDLPLELVEQLTSVAAGRWRCVVHRGSRRDLDRLCHETSHQGCLARMGPFPYRELGEIVSESRRDLALLVLDGIQDSFNLGAIVRSAAAFGIDGLILGTLGQSPITSQAARSSAGAVNRLPIARVESLPETLRVLREHGVRVLGTDPHAGTPLPQCDLRGAVAIVLGNESRGVSREVWECCTDRLRIPLTAEVESLNAAAAAAVVAYECWHQRVGAV